MDENAGRPRGVLLLVAGAGVVTVARAMSMTFLAIELHRAFGLRPAAIGFLLGIGPLLGAAAAPFAGAASDRIGRKPMLVLTLMAMALSVAGIGLARTLAVFCLAQTAAAIAIAIYGPLSKALISDICPPRQRLKYFSWRYTASNIGWTVGPMMGVAAGFAPTVLFVGAGLTYATLAFILYFLRLPVFPKHDRHAPIAMSIIASIKPAVRDPRMVCFIAGSTLLISVYGQWTATLAPYLASNITGGAEIFAYLVSVNGAVVLLGSLAARRFIERVGALHTLVTGSVLFAAGQMGFLYSLGFMGFAVSMMVFTIGEILVVPSEYMLVDGISDEKSRGSYYGAHALASVGSFLGPVLGGATFEFLGPPAMFALFAGFSFAGAVLYWAGNGRPPPQRS